MRAGLPLELRALSMGKAVVEPVTLSAKLDPLDVPEPPDDMPEDGKTLWRDTLPWLVQVNVVQSIDLAAFTQMCRIWAQAEKARKVLDKQGYFSKGARGQIVEHPAMKIWQSAQMIFLRHANEFGMTTMSRTRLGLMDSQRRSLQNDVDWTLSPSTRAADDSA